MRNGDLGGFARGLNISKGFRLALVLIAVAAVSYRAFSFAFSCGYSSPQRFSWVRHTSTALLKLTIQFILSFVS